MNYQQFYEGKEMFAYKYLGCTLSEKGATFRVYAPNAEKVSLIGEFNNWKDTAMRKVYDGNFWECSLDNIKENQLYKYRIYTKDGDAVEHCDPYGFSMETPPAFASITRYLDKFEWTDKKWLENRNDCKSSPLNIYEVHLGSFKRKDEDTPYTYKEIAQPLVDYAVEKGYNYIEIMPIGEHPCDNSWGYQQTGFYSPTCRYGTPDELRYLINYAHSQKVGVILDFVPVHFAVDGYALADFDGTAIYEYPHKDIGYNEWGSKNFNHSRGEVQSFLQSCANYWLTEFHFDGIRIDALSNIIYWNGDSNRGINKNALEFVKNMNSSLKSLHPTAMLIAEDSTSLEGVTKPTEYGGLGFDYKWDMGWMNDTLTYFKTHPDYRSKDYHKLTFSMMYFGSEYFLLPFSHDEVVHGKATILQKMNGQYEEKFPQAKALYLYMYTHPGKKLNFMGNEFGQLREWDETREQDWDIKKYPKHDSFSEFIKDLSHIYLNSPALHFDYTDYGFKWVDCNAVDKCVYVYERASADQKFLCVFNFSDKKQDYYLNTENYSTLRLLISTDFEKYGGREKFDNTDIAIFDSRTLFELQPFSAQIYEIISDA